MTDPKSYEETYRTYPFPILVDFGLALSGLFVRARKRRPEVPETAPEASAGAR